jgi:hypothetical protein
MFRETHRSGLRKEAPVRGRMRRPHPGAQTERRGEASRRALAPRCFGRCGVCLAAGMSRVTKGMFVTENECWPRNSPASVIRAGSTSTSCPFPDSKSHSRPLCRCGECGIDRPRATTSPVGTSSDAIDSEASGAFHRAMKKGSALLAKCKRSVPTVAPVRQARFGHLGRRSWQRSAPFVVFRCLSFEGCQRRTKSASGWLAPPRLRLIRDLDHHVNMIAQSRATSKASRERQRLEESATRHA